MADEIRMMLHEDWQNMPAERARAFAEVVLSARRSRAELDPPLFPYALGWAFAVKELPTPFTHTDYQ